MRYGFVIIIFLSIAGFSQDLRINEAMYSNDTCLFDAYGDSPDWIELYNNGTCEINLYNFYLSDKRDNLFKCRLPDTMLAPNSYVLFFASGRHLYSDTELHLNFSLGLMKDSIFLSTADSILLDSMIAVCAPTDYSLGRMCDGADSIVVFNKATPGASNNNASTVVLNYRPDSVIFSHGSGFYDSPFMLTLSNAISGNVILYTTNSKPIDPEESAYREPILIYDKTVTDNLYSNIKTGNLWVSPQTNVFKAEVIRAQAYSAGCPASKEYFKTFFITKQLSKRFKFDCVSIISNPKGLFDDKEGIYVLGDYDNCYRKGDEWEREAHFQMFNDSGNILIDQDIGIRIHGRGTRGAPQKSLRLYAKEKYGIDKFYGKLFVNREHDQFKRLILRTVFGDWSDTYFKDELIHELVKDMNVDYMDYKPVIAFINGEYWGIQNLRERQDNYYLDQLYNIENGQYDIIAYEKSTGPYIEEGDKDAYNNLISFLTTHDLKEDQNYEQVREMVDIDNCIDFFIAEIYFSNNDFPAVNVKMWKEKTTDSKWRWLFFDCDGCMIRGNFNQIFEYLNEDNSLLISPDWSVFILKQLLRNKVFKNQFYMRFLQLMGTDLSLERVLIEINQFEQIYEPSVAEHILRWNNPADLNIWKYNVDLLRTFAVNREVKIMEQLITYFGTPYIIAPNPSTTYFDLIFPESIHTPVTINIYNIDGSIVKAYNIDKPEKKIRIYHQLSGGCYMVKVEMSGFKFSDKLIVI